MKDVIATRGSLSANYGLLQRKVARRKRKTSQEFSGVLMYWSRVSILSSSAVATKIHDDVEIYEKVPFKTFTLRVLFVNEPFWRQKCLNPKGQWYDPADFN